MCSRACYQLSDAAAAWLMSEISTDRLLALVNSDPLVQEIVCRGGFKATSRNLARPALRRRLSVTLTRDRVLTERLLADPESPWQAAAMAVRALDASWLIGHWRELIRGRGDCYLAAAMAIDERPEIRERGLRLLRRRSPWQMQSQAQGPAIPADLGYFGAGTVPSEASAAAASEESGQILALKREIASVREALTRQREKVHGLEQALRESTDAGNERERELRRELRESKQEAAAVRAEIPDLVAQRLALAKQRLLDTSQVRDEDMGAALEENDDILEKVSAVLQAQERLNSEFGTREAIRRRIRQLCEKAERLAACIEESVRLHPEVRRLHALVCREIDHLRDVLQDDVDESHAPELSAQISAMVKSTPLNDEGLDALKNIERLLTDPMISELLGPATRQRLDASVDQRRRLMVELLHMGDDVSGASAVAPERVLARDVWDVDTELQRLPRGSVAVYIDGYNVTKGVPELAHIEEHEGLARSREELCELCRSRASRFQHVEIVFDGVGALSSREERDGITSVFSNGSSESQNADDYLFERLSAVPERECVRWLVTNDNGLRCRAQTCCDAFISAADWYAFIRIGAGTEMPA